MLFKQKDLDGIKAGTITVSFRNWKKLSVNVGSEVKTSVGKVRVGSIREVKLEDITDEEATEAGFASAKSLTGLLASQKEGKIYKIAVSFIEEAPKIEFSVQSEFSEEEFAELKTTLLNLDKFSKVGKWTTKTLQGIRENPKLKAADLAVKLKKEKEWLKLNVRKLTSLGLTISHEPGYTLSPKGEAYMLLIGK